MTTVAIVQARMTSTRLPGKVLLPILGRPMLSYQIEQMRRARTLENLVVATTSNGADDPIVALCEAEGVEVSRGSEFDVLARYQCAAEQFGATTVVRVTADCPLIDPAVIDTAVSVFLDSAGQFDYVSNMLEPTFPYGMAVEVLSAAALETANAEARDPAEREHVTPFVYWRPERFRLKSLTMSPDLSSHRWTVDTPEDFDLVSKILGELTSRHLQFGMAEVLHVIGENSSWIELNRGIEQRTARDFGGVESATEK